MPISIDQNCKIENCVSKDPSRPNLNNVFWVKRHKALFATNGVMVVCVPVEADEDVMDSCPIPVKVFKDLKATAIDKIDKDKFILLTKDGAMEIPVGDPTPIPNFDYIMKIRNVSPTLQIRIDPYQLMDMAKSMGVKAKQGVTLIFGKALEKIEIRTGENDNTPFGMLMPLIPNTNHKRPEWQNPSEEVSESQEN